MYLRGAGLSRRDHGNGVQQGNTGYRYRVQYIHQYHMNMCGDACVEMLLRFFNLPLLTDPSHLTNVKLSDRKHEADRFRREVQAYRSLAQDKRRDAAVALFEKYFGDKPRREDELRGHIPGDANSQAELVKVHEVVNNCILVKQQRDRDFGGLLNRWQRHKTKADGYVQEATPALFDGLLEAVAKGNAAQLLPARMKHNPRGPMIGVDEDQLWTNPGVLNLKNRGMRQDPVHLGVTEETLRTTLDHHGPIMVGVNMGNIRWAGVTLARDVGHWILLTGYETPPGGTHATRFFFHDPYAGANRSYSTAELCNQRLIKQTSLDDPSSYMYYRECQDLAYLQARR